MLKQINQISKVIYMLSAKFEAAMPTEVEVPLHYLITTTNSAVWSKCHKTGQ
jgi:hypothetical protein